MIRKINTWLVRDHLTDDTDDHCDAVAVTNRQGNTDDGMALKCETAIDVATCFEIRREQFLLVLCKMWRPEVGQIERCYPAIITLLI
jgi:hypothetical protein